MKSPRDIAALPRTRKACGGPWHTDWPRLCLWAACLILPGLVLGDHWETGLPPVQRHDFSNIQAFYLNHDIEVSSEGQVAVGTPSGLITYDGIRWSRSGADVNALVWNPDGSVCTAQQTGIARFHLNEAGEYVPVQVSLEGIHDSGLLPSRAFDVHRLQSGCLHVADAWLYWHADAGDVDAIRLPEGLVWRTTGTWPAVAALQGRWVSVDYAPETDLRLLPLDLGLTVDAVKTLVVLDDGSLLAAAFDGGLWRLEGSQTRPFAAAQWSLLAADGVLTARRLADGRIALGTARGGVWVFDDDGFPVERYGEAQGIAPLRVNALSEDQGGGLWIAQMRYVSRIDRGSAISRFDASLGLGDATAFARVGETLFAGTTNGLVRMRPGSALRQARFEPLLPNITDTRDLLADGESLWVLHDRRLSRLHFGPDGEPIDSRQIDLPSPVSYMQAARHQPRSLYVVAGEAVHRVSLDSGEVQTLHGMPDLAWIVDVAPESFIAVASPRDFLQIERGIEGWLTTPLQPVAPDITGKASALAPRAGLPALAPAHDGGVWMGGDFGLMSLEDDLLVASPETMNVEAPFTPISRMYEDQQGNLWVRGGGFSGVLWREAGGFRRDGTPLGAFDLRPSIHRFWREGDTLWVGRTDGALRLDLARRHPPMPPDPPRISSVVDMDAGLRPAFASPQGLQLPAAGRNLRLQFALPGFGSAERTYFRSRMQSVDRDFSAWDTRAEREFTNLPAGSYVLEVQAMDAWRRTTVMPPLRFDVAPAWYLRPAGMAGLGGAALFALVLSGIAGTRWRHRAMRREQVRLERLVEDRTRELASSNRRLSEQTERLRELDALKSRLFDNVSHEFRTPLTLVIGPIQDVLAADSSRLATKQRELLELAQRNAGKLLDLIVELMDLNRIEQGQLPMRWQRVQKRQFIERVLEDMAPLVEREGQALDVRIDIESGRSAVFDPLQIERCVGNLVGNAVKFGPRDGKVCVVVEDAGDGDLGWRVEVRDCGPGVAEKDLPHIFDRFYRAEESASTEGTGIGLALVREIVLAHGGQIDCVSTPGTGSIFTIRLPDCPPAARLAPTPATRVAGVEPDGEPGHGADEPDVDERQSPLVLLIEDHAELRDRLEELLGQHYRVVSVGDGESGLARAREVLPDCILSDVMMPGLDGLQLARRLRGDADTASIPLILLTARSGAAHAIRGLEAGADDYLTKPFDSGELLARVAAQLAQRRRLLHRLRAQPPIDLPATPGDDQRWLRRLEQVVATGLGDSGFGVEAIAKAMHTDRSTLFRRLKQQLGLSPSEMLREARLKRARDLLAAREGNVTEVAYAVGFESLSSFARSFRARFGCAPSAVAAEAVSSRADAF